MPVAAADEGAAADVAGIDQVLATGARPVLASSFWIGASCSTSASGASVVVTWVSRWGRSSSHVSVRCTL